MSKSEVKTPTVNEIAFDIQRWSRECAAAEPVIKKLGEVFAHLTKKYALPKELANPSNLGSVLYQLAGKAAVGAVEPTPTTEAPNPAADLTLTPPAKIRKIKRS